MSYHRKHSSCCQGWSCARGKVTHQMKVWVHKIFPALSPRLWVLCKHWCITLIFSQVAVLQLLFKRALSLWYLWKATEGFSENGACRTQNKKNKQMIKYFWWVRIKQIIPLRTKKNKQKAKQRKHSSSVGWDMHFVESLCLTMFHFSTRTTVCVSSGGLNMSMHAVCCAFWCFGRFHSDPGSQSFSGLWNCFYPVRQSLSDSWNHLKCISQSVFLGNVTWYVGCGVTFLLHSFLKRN